ncbi:Pimeloyl-ACP methyl ester carboxylesterase [Nocardioides terrae]|uniref:Pimeloyl-ACP methyl ester carboxylesterase n=1 Tax=Nocardioides terrae TaxID=574651 RepID=A0A1I1K6T0_9ACTN|nr:alpha/beta fold hydrolase [Nocardioides terrae]SFC56446.1 Pimeloyl-ACP methyl ester carboxylesterase [Nocardioides terrae]
MTPPDEPLVLLPGMGCSSRMWDQVLAAPDLDGSVSEVRRPALRGRSLGECVDALLDQLPQRFALAGLSLGAIVALALTRRAPDRVVRLALLAVNPRPPRPDQLEAWAAQRRALADGASARQLQEQLLPVLVTPRHRAELEPLVLRMADEVGEEDLDDQLAIQQTRIDERPALRRIGVPTLVLAGAQDALVPVARHEEVRASVPGARLAVLPHSGHLSTCEAPAEVAAELRRWLRGSDA